MVLRILFMGTPEFACPTLEALIRAGYPVVAVVTQPDRPAGRGGKLQAPPVKRLAEAHGIPVLQPRRVRHPDVVAQLRALAPDLVVTAAFGQILSAEVLAVPRLGCLNVHASLLPRWRGAAPIHRAVMAGDTETGITIMWMDEGLDTGDILLQRAIPIGPLETAGEVHDRLAALGAELAVEAVRLVEEGRAPRIPQDHARATYAAKLTPEDERIDWRESATQVVNRIRGLNPWPVAHTTWQGQILKVWMAEPWPEPVPAAPPGTVVAVVRDKGPVVACGEGAVLLTRLQPAGKRPMEAAAFLAGHRMAPGEVLGAEQPPAEQPAKEQPAKE